MGNVFNLKKYRAERKKSWLEKHCYILNSYLYEYMSLNFGVSFLQVSESYQSMKHANYEEAWDYIDLRDLLHSAFEVSFCDHLYEQLCLQGWFEKKLFTREELIEYFLSLYIMDSIHNTTGYS
ncbi:MAG: hypothetical protein HRU09_09540 [Oligoflexales bacterium]|nr:hypothetical protein [Oligoflexales bacterium]